VFALDAKTGAILWEHWSGIDQTISTVCCGWVNRGLAMGDGLLSSDSLTPMWWRST